MNSKPSPNDLFDMKHCWKKEDDLDYVDEPQLVPIIKQEMEDDMPHSAETQKLEKDFKFVIADLPCKDGDDISEKKLFHVQSEDTKIKLESTNGATCDDKFTIAPEELDIKEDLTEHNASQFRVLLGPNESEQDPFFQSNRQDCQTKTVDLRRNCRRKSFKYNQCSYEAIFRKRISNHWQLHQNPEMVKNFRCKVCHFRTAYKAAFKRHLVGHKNERNLANHLLSHHDRNEVEYFQCKYCQYKATHKSNLRRHLFQHKIPLEVENFKCNICGFKTICTRNMRKHRVVHKKPHEIGNFKSSVCDFTTIQKSDLANHFVLHKKTDDVTMFTCNQCNFQTIYKNSLKHHMQLHSNSKGIYSCYYCDYSTNRRVLLTQHILRHKKKLDKYECKKCGFRTTSMVYLHKHIVRQQKCTTEDLYKCDLCEYCTCYRSNLLAHFRKHHTNKFKCKECHYRTTIKNQFVSHKLRHKTKEAKDGGESKTSQNSLYSSNNSEVASDALKCDRCDFQTTYEHCLKMHLLQHKYSQLIKKK